MPIIPRSFYDAAEKGRQDRQQYEGNALRQQAMQQDVAQGQYVNNLMRDPTTTPEQFARAGRSDVGNSLLNIQRAPAQDQAEQVKQFATQIHAAAQYAAQAPPGQTKPFIEKNFPFLVQAYGPDWANATEDQVHGELNGIAAKYGVQAGIAPQQPKAPSLINGVGPDGKPVRMEDKVGITPYEKPNAPAQGDNFDPNSVENTAQMVAQGQIPMLSGFALKSKWGQAVVSRVRELNEGFNAADYKSQEQALKNFTSGKNGNTVRSLNVSVQHLEQLGQLATALGNGDTPMVNKAAIWWAKNTGQPAPTNFDAAKKIVADEIVKAVVGSGGGVSDREEAAAALNSAGSPAQLQQVIEQYIGLMSGQLNGLRQQYSQSTGRKDFERFLLPETRKRLEVHGEGANDAQPAPPQASGGWSIKPIPAGGK